MCQKQKRSMQEVIDILNGKDNVDKTLNGIPSLGVDYIGYPTARSVTLGVSFSL